MNDLLKAARDMEQEIIADRRKIHQQPEIGFDLSQTAEYVKNRLREMEIEPQDCGGPIPRDVRDKFIFAGFPDMEKSTGVTATIGNGGPCILLRADMDALPMEETTGLPFASQNGRGHMCGHDSHTAMLLGAARLLKEREGELAGTVKLMFQTGEECGCGSKLMIDAGVLENPRVDAALAIHVMADQEAGRARYSRGITSAAMDSFMVKIQGKGAHTSQPQNGIDPLMIANQLYTALNLLAGREVDPRETVALSVGKFGGGNAINVIPDTAEVMLAARTFNRDVRAHIIKRIPEIIDHTVKMWRGTYQLSVFATPSTFNDDSLCDKLAPFVGEIIGEENLCEAPSMAGTEDFGYVSEQVPGMFLCLGAGKPGAYPMHNPNMTLDESVFAQGSAILANCAIQWLKAETLTA